MTPDVAFAALDCAEMGLCVLHLERDEVSYDAGFCRLIGLQPSQVSTGMEHLYRMVPEEDAVLLREALDAHLAGETEFLRLDHRVNRADGETIWIETRGRVSRRNANGQPAEVTAVIQDCTRRHRAERGRKRLEQQLAQVQRMESVGALVGGIAHDFNNMLLAIAGQAELAMADLEDGELGEVTESLQEIRHATARAAELTQRLLSFGRQSDEAWDVVDLRSRLESLTPTLRRLVPASIGFDTDFGREPLWVHCDISRIEQALVNLCANAVDAVDEHGLIRVLANRVELGADQLDAYPWATAGDFVAVSVVDDGCGIPDDAIERVFDPFFTTKAVGEGTGLGLSVAFASAKQHDGLLRVESRTSAAANGDLECGSRFELLIPESTTARGGRRPDDRRHELHVSRRPAREGGAVILIAEDDAPVRKVVERMLGSAGYRVIAAADGAEAVALFAEHEQEIDLVLLDAIMPNKTGREVYEEITRARPELKVMFASGYTADVLDHAFFEREQRPLLAKPFSREVLLEQVASLLRD